jgi:hypothetical protein
LNAPAFLLSGFNVDTINNVVTDSGNVPSMPSVALFRHLDEPEIETFRQWARSNYKPLTAISGLWHPVIQAECLQMNVEAGKSFRLDPRSPFFPHDAMQKGGAA